MGLTCFFFFLKANRKISNAHNAANREYHEETRVKKKLEEEKKAMYGFSVFSCARFKGKDKS